MAWDYLEFPDHHCVVDVAKLLSDSATVSYIARYGGMCRDCADEGGICPSSGLPCANSRKAIEHVLNALKYGIEHKFLPVRPA